MQLSGTQCQHLLEESKEQDWISQEEQREKTRQDKVLQEYDQLNWLKTRKTTRYKQKIPDIEHTKDLRDWFNSLDADNSGQISSEELIAPLLAIGAADSIEDVHRQLERVDADGSGQIEFDEFCVLLGNSSTQTHHPLKDMAHVLKEKGLWDGSLTLQTAVPIYRRKDMMDALTDYGVSTTMDSKRRQQRGIQRRNLERAQVALNFERHGHDSPQSLTQQCHGIQHLHRQILCQSAQTRKRLASREKSLGIDMKFVDYFNQPTSPRAQTPAMTTGIVKSKSQPSLKASKRAPRVITYTYATGELIPHRTVIPLGERGRRKPLKRIQPIVSKGSAAGIVPKDLVAPIERRMKMLGLTGVTKGDVVLSKNATKNVLRKVGLASGRWGYG